MPWTYPIFVDLAGKTCLIAGYGHECVEKMLGLVEAGARVIWVSPQGPEEARILAETGRVEWRQRDFIPQHLQGCFLVVATGPDRSANARFPRSPRGATSGTAWSTPPL